MRAAGQHWLIRLLTRYNQVSIFHFKKDSKPNFYNIVTIGISVQTIRQSQ